MNIHNFYKGGSKVALNDINKRGKLKNYKDLYHLNPWNPGKDYLFIDVKDFFKE